MSPGPELLKKDFEDAFRSALASVQADPIGKERILTWRPEFPFACTQNNYPVVNVTELSSVPVSCSSLPRGWMMPVVPPAEAFVTRPF